MTNAIKVLLQMQSGFLQLESTLGMLDLHIAALGERESAVVAAIAYVTGGSSESQSSPHRFVAKHYLP
jgi:hypothetical protein